MLLEITLRLDSGPLAERVADDLASYSRWAETLELFGTGGWTALRT